MDLDQRQPLLRLFEGPCAVTTSTPACAGQEEDGVWTAWRGVAWSGAGWGGVALGGEGDEAAAEEESMWRPRTSRPALQRSRFPPRPPPTAAHAAVTAIPTGPIQRGPSLGRSASRSSLYASGLPVSQLLHCCWSGLNTLSHAVSRAPAMHANLTPSSSAAPLFVPSRISRTPPPSLPPALAPPARTP